MPPEQDADPLDLFFAPLTPMEASRPLKRSALPSVKMPDELLHPPGECAPEEALAAGHYADDLTSQVSFFEKAKGGVVDRDTCEAILGMPYAVRAHQTFLLCGRHYLAIEAVVEPPHRWIKWLDKGRVFIPWPDVLTADIFHHAAPPALLVQPDRYIAGTILNYYIARHGAESVELVK